MHFDLQVPEQLQSVLKDRNSTQKQKKKDKGTQESGIKLQQIEVAFDDIFGDLAKLKEELKLIFTDLTNAEISFPLKESPVLSQKGKILAFSSARKDTVDLTALGNILARIHDDFHDLCEGYKTQRWLDAAKVYARLPDRDSVRSLEYPISPISEFDDNLFSEKYGLISEEDNHPCITLVQFSQGKTYLTELTIKDAKRLKLVSSVRIPLGYSVENFSSKKGILYLKGRCELLLLKKTSQTLKRIKTVKNLPCEFVLLGETSSIVTPHLTLLTFLNYQTLLTKTITFHTKICCLAYSAEMQLLALLFEDKLLQVYSLNHSWEMSRIYEERFCLIGKFCGQMEFMDTCLKIITSKGMKSHFIVVDFARNIAKIEDDCDGHRTLRHFVVCSYKGKILYDITKNPYVMASQHWILRQAKELELIPTSSYFNLSV